MLLISKVFSIKMYYKLHIHEQISKLHEQYINLLQDAQNIPTKIYPRCTKYTHYNTPKLHKIYPLNPTVKCVGAWLWIALKYTQVMWTAQKTMWTAQKPIVNCTKRWSLSYCVCVNVSWTCWGGWAAGVGVPCFFGSAPCLLSNLCYINCLYTLDPPCST